MAKITIQKKSSVADEELEREVFDRLPKWCQKLLLLKPEYKHLYKSDSHKIEAK